MARLQTAHVGYERPSEPRVRQDPTVAPYLIVLDDLTIEQVEQVSDLAHDALPDGCVGFLVFPFPVEVL